MPFIVQPQQMAVDFDAELTAFMEDYASGKLAEVPVVPLSDANRRLLSGTPVSTSGMATHPGLPPPPGRTGCTVKDLSKQQALWGLDVIAAQGREAVADLENRVSIGKTSLCIAHTCATHGRYSGPLMPPRMFGCLARTTCTKP